MSISGALATMGDMDQRGRRTGLWIAGFALSGIVGAHVLTYRIAIPGDHARQAALESTGHSLWRAVVVAALLAVLGSAAAFARRAATHRREHARLSLPPYWVLVVRLTLLQALGFVALETFERVFVSGRPISVLASEPAFLLGLALQFAVAAIAALVILALTRVVELVCGRRRPQPLSHARPTWHPRDLLLAPPSVVASSASPRGPPLSL